MKRIILALALSLSAAPAFAAGEVYDVKFDGADGTTTTITFRDADKTTLDEKGVAGAYTYDDATKKLCATDAVNGARCATLGAALTTQGQVTSYVNDQGQTGTATLVSLK